MVALDGVGRPDMDTAVLSGALTLPEYETRRRESRSTTRII